MKCYIVKKKWISHQNTFRVPGGWLRIVFLSNRDVFLRLKLVFKWKNFLSLAFQNLTRFVVNSLCYKFLAGAFLHNDFGELDQMQLNIQGVEHDLRRIEQIGLRLYNIKWRYPACNTGSTRTNDNFANFFLQLGGTVKRCCGTKFNSWWHFCISWRESDQH